MFEGAWKYIAKRKILFGLVVLILALTPIVIKMIDSYTQIKIIKIKLAKSEIVKPSTPSENIKESNIYYRAGGIIDNKPKEIANGSK